MTEQLSPERQNLFERLARLESATAHLSRLRAAFARAEEAGIAAFRAEEAAEARLRSVRAAAPQAFVARMLGEGDEGMSVVDAEAAVAAASAAYDTIVSGQRILREQIADAVDVVRLATDARDDAIEHIVEATFLDGLVSAYRAASAELNGVTRALALLPNRPGRDLGITYVEPDDRRAAEIRAAIEALKVNAPLPGRLPRATAEAA
jgi:hypothetical protein